MSNVAVVFARGGSKGLPGKNIKKLLGKPLIYYSIELAKSCSFIDDVFVSTDDQKIKNIAIKNGVKIIDRPKYLATDKSAEFLFKCLYHVGLSNQPNSEHRNDGLKLNGYITAAVKCVPPGDKPTAEEKENCEKFLDEEFKILKNIKIVLGLGKIGFDSCLKYIRKQYPLKMKDYKFGHGVRYEMPNDIILYGSFHPSPRNVNTGRLNFDMMIKFLNQIKDELD